MYATAEPASTPDPGPRLYAFDAPVTAVDPHRLLGGKGVALRRLAALGFDVPPGFTITIPTARALRSSPADWDLLASELDAAVQQLAERSGTAWGRGPRPLTLAIRSGAAESHPGVMRTLLHCGWTGALAAASSVPTAWAEYAGFLSELLAATDRAESALRHAALPSLVPDAASAETLRRRLQESLGAMDDTPAAWLRAAIHTVIRSAPADTPTAVTVQAMVRTAHSGVLRSRDPLRPEREELVIEFVSGDGLRLMSGAATPDVLRVSRRLDGPTPGRSNVVSTTGPRAAALSATLVAQLRAAALLLEAEAGRAVEVEWGASDDRLLLFQYRAAQDMGPGAEFTAREAARLRQWAQQGRTWWVRHQLGEALPAPTPLTWSVWQRFVAPQGGLGALYRGLGYSPPHFSAGSGCLELIAGRIYADPDRWAQWICRSSPWRYDRDRLAATPEALQESPFHFDPARLDPWFLLTWPHYPWVLWRARRRRSRLRRMANAEFEETVVTQYCAGLERLMAQREATPQRDQPAFAEAVRRWLFDEQAPRLLLPGWLGVQAWQTVTCELRQQRSAAEAEPLIAAALQQLDTTNDSQRPAGDKSHSGWWATTPLELRGARIDTSGSPGDLTALCCAARELSRSASARRESLHREWNDRLGAELSATARAALQTAAALLPLRTVGKQLFLAGYELLRIVVGEMAVHSELGEPLYYSRWDELAALDRVPLDAAVLRQRQLEHEFWQRRAVPAVIDGTADRPFSLPPPTAHAGPWPLRVLSPGQGHGPLWQPSSPEVACPPGAVVVAESADSPAVIRWRAAAGIVVEQGGLLSHAAVTARQLGVPMGVLADATRRLQVVEPLWLDADRGELRSLRSPATL